MAEEPRDDADNELDGTPADDAPSTKSAAPPADPVTDPEPSEAAKKRRESAEEEEIGEGSTLDDFKNALRRNTAWVGAIGEFVGELFHYFFVGCASLLGLLIVLLIPTVIAASVAVLLGIPGYLFYRWFGTPGEYFSPWIVLVTIFWSGYFVTHGWPHLWPALTNVFGWVKPALVWMGRILENLSDEDDEEEPEAGTADAAAIPDDAETTGDDASEESDEENSTTKKAAKKKSARRSTKKKSAST